jgi:hypothetical protein
MRLLIFLILSAWCGCITVGGFEKCVYQDFMLLAESWPGTIVDEKIVLGMVSCVCGAFSVLLAF